MLRSESSIVLLLSLAAAEAMAQRPIPVGQGSYAESPPPSAGPAAAEMVQRTFPLVGSTDRPIPTNKLWTGLLNGKPSGALWMYPWRVDPKETGLELFFPSRWNNNGSDPVCESPLRVEGVGFRASRLLVKDWGDWTLSFRLPQSDHEFLDVTVGEGMPIVWIEPCGVQVALDAGRDAQFIQPGGRAVQFPFSGDRLIVVSAGRTYGVFVPPGTQFTLDGQATHLRFPQDKPFLAVAAMQQARDLATLALCAYAIPRDSRVDWSYDARRGDVDTTWTVKTEPLVPGQPDVVLQGWLPHHWRGVSSALTLDGPQYLTPRGTLKCSRGNRFCITYDFTGFLPNLPAPAKLGQPNDFDPARMAELLDRRAKNPKYGDDSYWGGKDLLHFAQYLQMARELRDPSYGKLLDAARRSLTDWLTYTPGEPAHYFTRYDNWHALIGIKDSYDSARFNDQHFHYGYLTLAAALLGMEDPEFLQDYGEMLRLVAKQYANWDRQDTRFPFFRTFDLWAGHSWAGGLGSPGGNNQESSSEAMQSWIGLYLLGTLLDDPQMTAAGAMGYAMESRATLEYWFDVHGDILPPEYGHPVVGVLWSGGQVYGTYFSGDPGWIYGIQCLPQSPGLDYLAREPEFARKLFHDVLAQRKAKEGSDDLGTMGDLGNVLLAQASLVDPLWAVQQFDRLWDANNGIVRDHLDAARTYYQAHAYRRLGQRQWDVRLSVPTSAVYRDERTQSTSYAVYNPKPYPVTVKAAQGDTVLGCFAAPARQLTCVTKLEPISQQTGLAGSLPAHGDPRVSRRLDAVSLLFHVPVVGTSLVELRIEGPDAPRFVSVTGEDEGRVVICKLAKPLTPGAKYRVTVGRFVQRPSEGQETIVRGPAIEFTVEPQPPLALEASLPADGQERVALVQPDLLLTFNASMDLPSMSRVRLDGAGAPGLTPQLVGDGSQVKFQIAAPLQPDQTYSLVVPAGVASIFGHTLASDRVIRFTTAPPPCPPNVYRESFAGGGYSADKTLEVDLRNALAPHSGQYAIKLHAPQQEGSVYFFAGTSDHGDGRKPVDLSAYRRIEFWLRSNTDRIWVKVGHPVFDKNAFTQTQLSGVTRSYQRFTLDLPEPKREINTLLVISVPAGATVFLDDVRFSGARAEDR